MWDGSSNPADFGPASLLHPTLTPIKTAVSAEELFLSLEGRTVLWRGEPREVHVYSICDADGYRWVQVGLGVDDPHTFVLRLNAVSDYVDALAAISDLAFDDRAGHA